MIISREDSIKIIIGGDVCPVGRNEPFFCSGDIPTVMGDLLPVWMAADLRIANLECPLIAMPAPIKKTGPLLGADERAINGMTAMRVDIVGLANNHILDHGANGLLNTIRLCRENGIGVVGAGADSIKAGDPLIRNIKGLRVGVIAMADLEWSIANRNSAGANPFSFPCFLKVMRRLRNECDHIIALMHLGKEHYPYPSPELQEMCRCMVEEGVSVIVCQHSHCVGASEYYNDGFICYGQGNLVFDNPEFRMKSWQSGQLIEVSLTTDGAPEIKSIPYAHQKNGYGLSLLSALEADHFHAEMKKMQDEIQDIIFVEQKWIEFCCGQRDLYLALIRGYGKYKRKLSQIMGHIEYLYSDSAIAVLENIVRSHAHRELLLSILSIIRNERWNRK